MQNVEQSGAKYLLSNFHIPKGSQSPAGNWDIDTARHYPVNLMLPPFNFTSPLAYVLDMDDSWYEIEPEGKGIKYAAVWEVSFRFNFVNNFSICIQLPALNRGNGLMFDMNYTAALQGDLMIL